MPEDSEYDYPWEQVQFAYWLFKISRRHIFLNQDEAAAFDPKWVDDLRLAMLEDGYMSNSSAFIAMAEEYAEQRAKRKRKAQENGNGVSHD